MLPTSLLLQMMVAVLMLATSMLGFWYFISRCLFLFDENLASFVHVDASLRGLARELAPL